MSALVPVRVKDCPYPDHSDGHSVFLRPTISLEGGIAAEQAMLEIAGGNYSTDAERVRALTYAWAPIFTRYGAADWDFCDDAGEPIPFDIEAVLADYSIARLVADKAGDLGYGNAVMAPFDLKPARPSPTTRTPGTTSARPRRTPKSSE